MLMHAVTPPRFAAGSLRSKEEKTIEYMECTDRIGACNDPATLRCGITAPQNCLPRLGGTTATRPLMR